MANKLAITLGIIAATAAGIGGYLYLKKKKEEDIPPVTVPATATVPGSAVLDFVETADEVQIDNKEIKTEDVHSVTIDSVEPPSTKVTVTFPSVDTEDYVVKGNLITGAGPYLDGMEWDVGNKKPESFDLYIKKIPKAMNGLVFEYTLIA